MESEDLFSQHDTEELHVETDKDNIGKNSFNIRQSEIDADEFSKEEANQNTADELNEHIEDNDDEVINNDENEAVSAEKNDGVEKTNKQKTVEPKLVQLPLSKIRALMKLDPDMQLASTEAVFAVTKATELFIESLAKESYSFTARSKKKTVQKGDVDLAIASVDSLMFLEGSMNF